MKVSRNVEAIVIVAIYLLCIYFWTIPIQESKYPYGEVDASSHYAIAEYTFVNDESIGELPFYIDRRYGLVNKFKSHVLWYPPPFHTALAISAVFGGESDVPIHIANAIFSSLIVLSVYFLIRRFYGFTAAVVSSVLLIFSVRDILIYLWGQWPERMGFAYLPLILYCYYKYTQSVSKKDEKPIYMYIMAILLAVNLYIHPMDFFHSIGALGIITILLLIKYKKFHINWKHTSIAIIVFLLLISIFPSQTGNVLARVQTDGEIFEGKGDFSRLLTWFKPQVNNQGVPNSYFSYKEMIGPIYTIPFIFLGIIFLFIKRRDRDIFLLGWLISLYIMIHLDYIGIGRVHRSLSGSSHIFFPLMALGVLFLLSFIPKIKYRDYIKFGIAIVFTYLVLTAIVPQAIDNLKNLYGAPYSRVNDNQNKAIEFLYDNTKPGDYIYHMGSLSLSKTRWIRMMSERYIVNTRYEERRNETNYVIVDYSDYAMFGEQAANVLNQLRAFEEQELVNSTKVYDSEFVKIYSVVPQKTKIRMKE